MKKPRKVKDNVSLGRPAEIKNAVRRCVMLPKDHDDYLKKLANRMSVQEARTITVSEMIRFRNDQNGC